jgi:Flp pilus assembly protein TadG
MGILIARGRVEARTGGAKMLNQIAAFTRKFCRAEQGAVAIIAAIALVPMVGLIALAADYGSAIYKKQMMQTAADQAAYSAATALSTSGTAMTLEGLAVAGANGFANGSNGVAVAVNNPPTSGPYASNSSAVQVVITQPVTLSFVSAICSVIGGCSGSLTLSASSVVAASGAGGAGCILQLGATPSPGVQVLAGVTLTGCGMAVDSTTAGSKSTTGALVFSGAPKVNLDQGQSISVAGGVGWNNNLSCAAVISPSTNCPGAVKTSQGAAADPYNPNNDNGVNAVNPPYWAGYPNTPPVCSLGTNMTYLHSNINNNAAQVINPGVWCNGVHFTSDAVISLKPGTYYVYGGAFVVDGDVTMTGTGVTIVLTGKSTDGYTPTYANFHLTAGAKVNLIAPTTGTTAGIVFFEDRNAPSTPNTNPYSTNCLSVGCSVLDGGSAISITGAIYLPTRQINFMAGVNFVSTACTQVIANSVIFSGGIKFQNNCSGTGTKTINVSSGKLALVQ